MIVYTLSGTKSGETQNYLDFPAKELLGETKHRNKNEHHDGSIFMSDFLQNL